jgi:hypothetical protein
MDQPARIVLTRPPCEWCAGLYQAPPATVEVVTRIGGAACRLCDACADLIGFEPRIPLVPVADTADLLTASEAAAYLDTQEWTFAKTTPDHPHEYLLLRKSTDPWTHLRVIRLIRERGHERTWQPYPRGPRSKSRYWLANNRLYWTMPRDAETIINRREAGPGDQL